MDDRANKNKLINTLRIERARWDMLLVQVDSARMMVPGVEGHMSVRDIIADVVTQERWVANRLQLSDTYTGEPDAPEDEESEERGHSLTVGELMAESRKAFEQIVRVLTRLPAEEIFDPQPYEWTGGNAVAAMVPVYTVEHYKRHYASIRSWMTKRRRRRSQARSS
jgi:hypothetical protein